MKSRQTDAEQSPKCTNFVQNAVFCTEKTGCRPDDQRKSGPSGHCFLINADNCTIWSSDLSVIARTQDIRGTCWSSAHLQLATGNAMLAGCIRQAEQRTD
jgi:hypothetical protein